MSQFATPFIVINLGCEMIYIIDQRLKAQKITCDKSERVLTDVTSVLLHSKLLDELFIPQPVATDAVIKQLLRDISASSIMKLDDYSMSKLWDLMTMMFKWQLSVVVNQNIFDITRRHLRCVVGLLSCHFPKCIIEQTMRRFEALSTRFTEDDYKCLYNTLIIWFSEYHVKISILLRLGLQRKDGTFCLPSTVPPKFLENLGDNIYNYDNKKKSTYDFEFTDTEEISCLLSQINKVNDVNKPIIELRLPIELGAAGSHIRTLDLNTQFENIQISIKNRTSDLTFTPEYPKSPQEDLLQMLKLSEQ